MGPCPNLIEKNNENTNREGEGVYKFSKTLGRLALFMQGY